MDFSTSHILKKKKVLPKCKNLIFILISVWFCADFSDYTTSIDLGSKSLWEMPIKT